MHRVRLLRAGLPEPRPDHHAPPADRAAARDGPPAARARRCWRRCSSSTSTTRIETCAADGICSLACPVGIDTGKLVKELRAAEHAARRRARGAALARRWSAVESSARAGLRAGARWRRRPPAGAHRASAAALLGEELIPAWSERDAGAGAGRPAPRRGPRGRRRGVLPRLHQPHLRQPPRAARTSPRCRRRCWPSPRARACRCGSRRTSPGTAARPRGARRATARAAALMARRMAAAALRWTGGGRAAARDRRQLVRPGAGWRRAGRGARTSELRERLAAVRDDRLDRVGARAAAGLAAARPGGSGRWPCTGPARPSRAGSTEKLREIAGALAEEVIEPLVPGCCGMAGDRGLLHPELPAAALARRRRRAAGRAPDALPVAATAPARSALEQATGAALRVVRAAARGAHAAGARRSGPKITAAPAGASQQRGPHRPE